jgi:hypothetical protein
MTKLSKSTQLYYLVDLFIDQHPETELAIEWRELISNGMVKAFMLAIPVPKMELRLSEKAKHDLSVIKPLLGLS